MKKVTCLILSILIFITPILAQDTYPFFSDPEKQLLFGSKKIEIVFKESTKQIISGGGSQFNPLYFLFEDMPMLYNSPVSTSYIYHSDFKIFQNNRELSEIDFLEIIGLSDKANSIKAKYRNRMEDYYRNSTYEVIETDVFVELFGVTIFATGLLLVVIAGLVIIFDPNPTNLDYKNNYEEVSDTELIQRRKNMFLSGLVMTPLGLYILSYSETKKVTKNRERPVLKQQLSNTQITDLAESYNRRIYQEIK